MDTLEGGAENEEELEKPDPILKAPELYACAKENQTNEVLAMLEEGVPPFFSIKRQSGRLCIGQVSMEMQRW